MSAKLVLVPRNHRGITYEIAAGQSCVIGRDPSANICLVDPSVSRQHATISNQDGRWYLEDHSQNGTRIDGQKYKGQRIELRHNVRLQIGTTLDHTVLIATDGGETTYYLAAASTVEAPSTVVSYPEELLRVSPSGEVWVGSRRIDLSERECLLVRYLYAKRDQWCSNEELIQGLFSGVGTPGNIQELIKRVRDKFERAGVDGGRYIKGRHGGYILHTKPK
ncbi:MAG: FHA domain-containing protein [Anaerolineae bacterium]|nr:FHA domain-containing protein [Anaerolineae bacterium]